MTVPDYTHDAQIIRYPSGWQRWDVRCPCGWRWHGVGGRQAAEQARDLHNGIEQTCDCYSPETMEYAPIACSCCKANGNG